MQPALRIAQDVQQMDRLQTGGDLDFQSAEAGEHRRFFRAAQERLSVLNTQRSIPGERLIGCLRGLGQTGFHSGNESLAVVVGNPTISA